MKRPYISGPMTGIPHHNFPDFYFVEEKLRELGYDPINPARYTVDESVPPFDDWVVALRYAQDNPRAWEEYIHADIKLMMEADGIVLMDGWRQSRGSCTELVVAVNCGLPVGRFWMNDALCMAVDDGLQYLYDVALAHLVSCKLSKKVEILPV